MTSISTASTWRWTRLRGFLLSWWLVRHLDVADGEGIWDTGTVTGRVFGLTASAAKRHLTFDLERDPGIVEGNIFRFERFCKVRVVVDGATPNARFDRLCLLPNNIVELGMLFALVFCLVCVAGIEPIHICTCIGPECNHQHHASAQRLAHLRQSAINLSEGICTPELLRRVGSSLVGEAGLEGAAILNQLLLDFHQGAVCITIVGDEASCNREGQHHIHVVEESMPGAILAKSVHVSSIAVAFRFALLVLGRVAHTLRRQLAWVRSHGRNEAVCLEQVHLRTAGGIVIVLVEAFVLHKAEVRRALGVTITQTTPPARNIHDAAVADAIHVPISIHRNQVYRSIHSSWNFADVDVKRDLPREGRKLSVALTICQVNARAIVGCWSIWVLRGIAQRNSSIVRRTHKDTVAVRVPGSFEALQVAPFHVTGVS
mmetsp:Transcript_20253/g.47979  ORF Transcript_20253/g.47979 Transcript_20253/m.47979 type:complete len:430 (-) Transcript_20253:290-1579(-)